MAMKSYEELRRHIGHDIECVCYAPEYEYEGDPANVSLECMTCMEVLISYDKNEDGDEDD